MPGLSTGEFDGVILSDAPGPVANLDFALHELFAITSKYTSRSFQETASVESEFHRGTIASTVGSAGRQGHESLHVEMVAAVSRAEGRENRRAEKGRGGMVNAVNKGR